MAAANKVSQLSRSAALREARAPARKDLERLKHEYDAVIISGGCMLPTRFDLPGMDAKGVYWGLDFMMAANRDELDAKPSQTVVIGGGFTALESTR